ncbi:MAG: DegT/DnrJ/EryC1/StrS family aminotransferase [Candidatus Saccharibacteria bacterium]|nr:DegT/DnrJ/EryC1/StrS family aminotransferase [Candidatus Saccharibacteria bacterium]
MIFLGQASRFGIRGTFRHLFAHGNGRDITDLEEHLAWRYGVDSDDVILYHTGRTALAEAIKYAIKGQYIDEIAIKRRKRGMNLPGKGQPEVVITSLTCYAVVEAVRAAGAIPVFADVDPETLHFDGDTLTKALRNHSNVRAIVVQNNLGHPCKIKEIEKIANRLDIPLVEDLAHCAGCAYEDGREMGTLGVAAALSFGKGKSIDTTSGGALVIRGSINTKSSDRSGKEEKAESGAPMDFSSKYIPVHPRRRPKLSDRLRDRFYPFFGMQIRGLYHIHLGKPLTAILLKLHFIQYGADAVLDPKYKITKWQARLAMNQFDSLPENRPPLRDFYLVKDADETIRKLAAYGYIFNDTWYDSPVSPKRYFRKAKFTREDCPKAVELAHHIVNVPNWYSEEQLATAIKIIKSDELKSKKGAKK